MKWYITSDSVDWADEFDLPFGEILDQSTYERYKYLSEVLKSYTRYYGFGTNEYFDDFEYLGWEFTEITEEEKKVLEKLGLPNGYTFVDRLFEVLEEDMFDNDIIYPEDTQTNKYGRVSLKEDLLKMPFEKFAMYVDKYNEFLNEESEDE